MKQDQGKRCRRNPYDESYIFFRLRLIIKTTNLKNPSIITEKK